MSNIITFDGFADSEIRVTPNAKYSVFDVIKFCGQKNPREPWKRLCGQYPEVVTKCDNFKFPGKGQRNTPVASRENILYIVGLLPGAVGRAYREEAAKVFLQYLDASPELAESVIDRATPDDLKRIEQRLKSRQIRVHFTSVLHDHGVTEGWQFGDITNTIYKGLIGGTAKAIRQERNLPAKANIRDSLDFVELSAVMLTESLSSRDIQETNKQGYTQCKQSTQDAVNRVKRVFE